MQFLTWYKQQNNSQILDGLWKIWSMCQNPGTVLFTANADMGLTKRAVERRAYTCTMYIHRYLTIYFLYPRHENQTTFEKFKKNKTERSFRAMGCQKSEKYQKTLIAEQSVRQLPQNSYGNQNCSLLRSFDFANTVLIL